MHFDKGAELLDVLAYGAAGGGVGRDGRTDRDTTVLGDLGGHVADAADVEVAVLFREAEFGRQVLAHDVTVQEGYRTATHFHQLDHERICDGRFARA